MGGPDSSFDRLRATIAADRERIAGGEHPTYFVRWGAAIDGSIDVTIEELPLIHQFVPDEARVLDGARSLIARTLEVDPGAFDLRSRRAPPQEGPP